MKLSFEGKDYDAVIDIASRIKEIGGRAFLVGGCVRDALLGHPGKDLDVEIYGVSAEALENAISGSYDLSRVGMSFGVLKVHGHEIDIALPRTESKVGAGHRGFIVDTKPDLSYEEATARRDFTINAIMYNPLDGEFIDPWHGIDDLHDGIIRHTSRHFTEDPLRVLRCMQFVARLGFSVAPETISLCSTLSQDELPPERLAGEWEKLLLKGRRPMLGLEFLRDCGWVRFYPELNALIGCEQSSQWHPEGDVWIHTLLALDAAVDYRTGGFDDDLCLMLGVLCHDFGKPATSVCIDGKISSKGHSEAGIPLAESFVSRIWNRPDIIRQVAQLVKHHMEPFFLVKGNSRDAAYRRLALDVKRMDLLYKVSCCDTLGIRRPGVSLECMDKFWARTQELALKDSIPKPIVLGRHLMPMGIQPGPEMGKLLHSCFEAQLEGEFTDLEGGLAFARKLCQSNA